MSTIGPPPRFTGPITQSASPFGPHPARTKAVDLDGDGSPSARSEAAAERAERQADARINDAQRRVAQEENDADVRIDHLQDQFAQRENQVTAEQDNILERQRLKGYEALRDLRRNQQKEISELKRTGDQDKARLENYYNSATVQADHAGKQKLTETEQQNFAQLEAQRRNFRNESEETRAQQETMLQELKADSEYKYGQLAEKSHSEYERLREGSAQARAEQETKFQDKFAQVKAAQDEIIGDMYNRASHNIREVRQDTSQKLSAYSSRQADPFYKMVDLDMRMHDAGDGYILTARIPEYEQKHISVAIKGNQLVVSGYRRNEEKLDLDQGHAKGTAIYQSFHESFPLASPVDSKHLEREFRGNELIVSVPKKKEYTIYQAPPPKTDRAHVEKPQFPENLTPMEGDKYTGLDDGPKRGNPRTNGAGTLT